MYHFNTNMYLYDRIVNFISRNQNFKPFLSEKVFYSDKIYNAVNRFGIPSFEYGAQDLINKLFPFTRDKKFIKTTVKQADVLEFDLGEVDVYKRSKPFNVKDIGLLYKVYAYIRNKINNYNDYLTLSQSLDTLPKNTSSCYPEYTKKSDSKTIKNTKNRINRVLDMVEIFEIYNYIRKFPTTIFHRFSPKMKLVNNTYDPSFKIRQIFGVPFFIVVLEKFIFNNFVTSYKNSFWNNYMVGKNKVQISEFVSKIRNQAKLTNKLILCGDISGCDKSISRTHSTLYFQMAYDFINLEYVNIFYALFIYYVRTPILYKLGIVYSNGSTVSGSWITSSFNSVCVQIALLYSFHKLYNRFPTEHEYLFQGDDFVILISNDRDKFLFKQYMLEFNLRIRLDRSELVTPYQNIEFLGYFWNEYNEPDQTDEWIVSRIMYPEKFIKFDGDFRLLYRILSIIINLKRFRVLYNRLYQFDDYLKYLLNVSEYFTLFDSNNNALKVRVPLKAFLTSGWRMM